MSELGYVPDWFSKPGDTLAVLMARRALSVEALASELHGTREIVEGLLTGTHRIDERLAATLAASVGGSAAYWRKRQEQYDEALDRATSVGVGHETLAWLRTLPLGDMRRAGWVAPGRAPRETLRSVLSYFDVNGLAEWRDRYATFATDFAFRSSPSFESKIGALAAWLRQGELRAARSTCRDWDRQRLIDQLPNLRRLTRLKNPTSFLPRLREVLADVGVAAVIVRSPAGCRASGATRFISPTKAMVILSFRYLADDQFWFTVFHEVGHLVLHGDDATFIDLDDAADSIREQEADAFAANHLVSPPDAASLTRLRPHAMDVIAFARSIGVSPGIVVGQMQHFRIIGQHQLNRLKRRYTWEQIARAARQN